MKRLILSLAAVTLFFAAAAVLWLTAVPRLIEKRTHARTVTVNRLNDRLERAVSQGIPPEQAAAELMNAGEDLMPDSITYIPCKSSSSAFTASGSGGTFICTVYSGGTLTGFAEYNYSDPFRQLSDVFVLTVLAVCWLGTVLLLLLIWLRVLLPFRRLSDYPERLSKMPDTDKLPESKDRRFGKFVWSMNLLRDALLRERRLTERLACQRSTLLASLAHGVKTPVTNIRLYAEAIKTGLYTGEGGDNAALAEKIDRNAEKIQSLVTELIDVSASAVGSYTPEISAFYVPELSKLISAEFSERMAISRIPFSVECRCERMMHSDRYGLLRIVSQFIENAVKYGGGGITVSLESDPDGVCISVRNKGKLLPEEELLSVFNSFHRGSNSQGVEGSGIGLFTAKTIANALGGSICARRLEESSEMEFEVYIPD